MALHAQADEVYSTMLEGVTLRWVAPATQHVGEVDATVIEDGIGDEFASLACGIWLDTTQGGTEPGTHAGVGSCFF